MNDFAAGQPKLAGEWSERKGILGSGKYAPAQFIEELMNIYKVTILDLRGIRHSCVCRVNNWQEGFSFRYSCNIMKKCLLCYGKMYMKGIMINIDTIKRLYTEKKLKWSPMQQSDCVKR